VPTPTFIDNPHYWQRLERGLRTAFSQHRGGVEVKARRHATQIAILADRRLLRDAIASCLARDPDFAIVGHVAAGNDLLELCELRQPDVVLASVTVDLAEALTAFIGLRDRFRAIQVVVAYDQLSPANLATVWRAGVDHLVPSSHGLYALRLVLHQCARASPSRAQATVRQLTDQEREILALVSGGHTACRIAELLNTTSYAVENHKRRIYRKLSSVNQGQAVARAAALGIIDRPQADSVVPDPRPTTTTPDPMRPGGAAGSPPELTARESDILQSIARGHTVRQTARSLGIAMKTVENTQARLFRKLGAHNRPGTVAAAYGLGLIDPEPVHRRDG
jgi:DNA-binding NarL/FixJ family response regulator